MSRRTVPTIRERLEGMSVKQRIGIVLGGLVALAFIITFFTFERQIFQLLEPAVIYFRKSSAGMWVMACVMCATCIFPLFGYGVVSMVCGYVFGMPKGFIPAFVGDIVGASAGFWLYRLAFRKYIYRKFNDNIDFREMSKAVSKDGIFVLFLIRLSSFPFAVLNAYFGSMTKLPYYKFILATTLSTPRLFLPIFIGHNLSSLANPDITGTDRVLKWVGNILGIIIALGVGWYIYRHTNRRIERINAGLAAEEGEEDNEFEERYRQQHLEHAIYTSQSPVQGGAPFNPAEPLDKHKHSSTSDITVSMEELEILQTSASGQVRSAETIVETIDSQQGKTNQN
ncbi:Tlg2-vesicle protein [Lobosporangium transversale]|uniref:Golgi apparatus membrane protein TVP38 n=1 Tax=Lobosporangium transversale TaxID=64571 RepID=A0A1Y2GIZ0_9FUNG|nr:snare associated Golgi protein-domain-containing protein [Lobosporangium transversale]KAF9914005.1 Tlg2-vesicle protein [Lobosporangium transversale]ORZ12156.1 snare associated Golgi protein-domain-containing protein [Lobosporangium transversale]|eukprot:XP_021880021.1 snare associated Golgi protein-domain-containing protein [Lobosporangium transversale]